MAYTTIYTSDINYPTNYYRAYVDYQLTNNTTSVTINLKYGVALHSNYVGASYEQTNREVACSVGTGHDPDDSTSWNKLNIPWTSDNVKLGPTNEGKSYWHQTGTASITINKNSSTQTLYILAWGRITGNNQTRKTNYDTITIPALPTYTIKYSANGGSGTTTSQTKTHGNSLTLRSALTRTGYTFSKWKATDGTLYDAGGSYTKNEGTTLTAQWTANTYTISYNTNGGSPSSISSQTKTYGTPITLSSIEPTKSGYTFSNWKATDGTLYEKSGSYTKNEGTTLTAQWTVYTKTFKFNANSGTGTMSNQVISYASSPTATTNLNSNTFTKSNYTFIGWNTKSDGSGTSYTNQQSIYRNTITSNSTINLYAQWELTYTPPKINFGSWICKRTDSTDSLDTGNYGHIELEWDLGKDNNNYNITTTLIKARYREKTTPTPTWIYITGADSTWTPLENSITTFEAHFGSGNIASEKQYEVEVLLSNEDYTDSPTTKIDFISNETFVIDINADGSAIGFLQPVTDNNSGIYINNTILMKDSFLLTATDSQNKNAIVRARQTDGGSTIQSSIALLANTNNNHGLYSDTHGGNGQWLIYSDNSNIYIGNKNITCAFPQYINQSYTSDKSTANTWTYTGISFTVPTNHLWIVRISESYTWGKPKGIGLHTSNSFGSWATAPYMASYVETGVETLSCVLIPNTYYIYTYRDSTIASGNTNTYNIIGLDFQIA